MPTSESKGQVAGQPPLTVSARPLTVKGSPVDPNLRIMASATLVNTFGNGALMTTFALFFTRVVGLRPTQVALAISAGALAGLVVQVPAGHLADLRGPRRVLQTFTFGAGVAILGLSADGPGPTGASRAVPRLCRHGILVLAHGRPDTDHVAVHRLGPAPAGSSWVA